MKIISFVLCYALFSPPAFAGFSLIIEHPRKNNRQKIENKISCHENCQWASSQTETEKGTSPKEVFSKDLKVLHSLMMGGQYPKTKKLIDRETYVNITVSDDKETRKIQLGQARHYKGDNLKKFILINDLITKIEFNLLKEKVKR